MQNLLCAEIDNPDDLAVVISKLKAIENRSVYMCFASDIIHGGHITIIRKAARLGKLTIGVLSDEAVASYKRLPLVPESERRVMFENITGVHKVVLQKTLSYKENLKKYHPDIVVHGDDWVSGFQKPIRDEVVSILASYGGKLVEFPYSSDPKYIEIDSRSRADLVMPDVRRGRLDYKQFKTTTNNKEVRKKSIFTDSLGTDEWKKYSAEHNFPMGTGTREYAKLKLKKGSTVYVGSSFTGEKAYSYQVTIK